MANLNTALTPAPVITVVNKDGTTATGYTGNVTMTLDTNPTNATLGGTDVVAASSGVATFSNLTVNRSGKDFTLRATAAEQGGYTPRARVSRPFTIATSLVFTIQPAGTAAAGDIMEPFQVSVKDSAGNVDTNYAGEITVALYTGASLGILGGFTTRTATAGVADFSGLSIDANGTYSLRATAAPVTTAYNPAPAISSNFPIGILTLTISTSQTNYNVYNRLVAAYGSVPSNALVSILINNSTAVISSTDAATPALTMGSGWTGTPLISVLNVGYIIGYGGAGGNGGNGSGAGAQNGGNGGIAIDQYGLNVVYANSTGYIWGGGGGGGGGGYVDATIGFGAAQVGGGGGNGGAGNGAGGVGGNSAASFDWTIGTQSTDGESQTNPDLRVQSALTFPALGANASNGAGPYDAIAGVGGISGDYGADGGSGGSGTGSGAPFIEAPGSGGIAGKAIELNGGSATFINGGGSPNVKGAVS